MRDKDHSHIETHDLCDEVAKSRACEVFALAVGNIHEAFDFAGFAHVFRAESPQLIDGIDNQGFVWMLGLAQQIDKLARFRPVIDAYVLCFEVVQARLGGHEQRIFETAAEGRFADLRLAVNDHRDVVNIEDGILCFSR